MNSEPGFAELRKVASKALEEYDYLLERYNVLVEEHNSTKAKLSADIDALKTVFEPMFDEYGDLKAKYQSEKTLRITAESYAAKVMGNNKQIKRQSAMLMKQLNTSSVNVVDIDINGLGDSTSEDKMQEERINQLNDTVSELQAENGKLKSDNQSHKTEITDLREELSTQLSRCARLEKENLKINKELKSLNRMSNLAVNNHQQLQENLDRERELRIAAESYATKLQRTRNSQLEVQRQTLLVSDPSQVDLSLESITKKENDELRDEMKALVDKEKDYLRKIAKLENELSTSSTYNEKESQDEKLSTLVDELDQVRTDYYDSQSKIKQLEQQVAKLEKERDNAHMVPIPPPPPPPPPPTKTLMQSLSDIVKSTKKKQAEKLDRIVGSGSRADGMQKALDEMMKRIQGSGGMGLSRVDIGERPGDLKRSDEPEAIVAGQAILNNLKKTQRRANIPIQENESENELMKQLSKRKLVLDSTLNNPDKTATS